MRRPHRSLPAAACLLSLLAACGDAPSHAATKPRPDVVMIVIDTLRADRLEPYGYDRPTSPTLDRLAREGVLCEDVTAQGSWTKPSVVSLLQGRYLTEYRDLPVDDAPTMAEIFRDAGYRTVGVVGNVLLSDEEGFHRGFQHYDYKREGKRLPGQMPSRSGQEIFDASAEPLADALALDERGERPPLFAWLHLMEPHSPYVTHPEYADELRPHVSVLGDRMDYFESRTGTRDLKAWSRLSQKLAAYDQEVRAADEWVRKLLARLESQGALGNTVVAVVSDHGEGLWEQFAPEDARESDAVMPEAMMFGGHGKVIDRNLVATPMILWGAGVPAGQRIREPVANVDLFPTLLELCDITRPETLHGRSLVPALHGEELAREPMYSRVLKESAVRDPESGWRLVSPTAQGAEQRERKLFNLTDDPREREDRSDEHPEVVARLESLLLELAERYPTETSLGRERSATQASDMKAMGYAGDDG